MGKAGCRSDTSSGMPSLCYGLRRNLEESRGGLSTEEAQDGPLGCWLIWGVRWVGKGGLWRWVFVQIECHFPPGRPAYWPLPAPWWTFVLLPWLTGTRRMGAGYQGVRREFLTGNVWIRWSPGWGLRIGLWCEFRGGLSPFWAILSYCKGNCAGASRGSEVQIYYKSTSRQHSPSRGSKEERM